MTRLPRRLAPIATLAAICSLGALPATAEAATTLNGVVGPGFTITLRTAGGVTVRQLAAGRAYTIVVADRSDDHNFRLAGPGVVRSTGVAFRGTVRWNVTFRAGAGSYLCSPHSFTMRTNFRVV